MPPVNQRGRGKNGDDSYRDRRSKNNEVNTTKLLVPNTIRSFYFLTFGDCVKRAIHCEHIGYDWLTSQT